MVCDVFPCMICDHLDGLRCTADTLGRSVRDMQGCALTPKAERREEPFRKPDIGKWIVKQPDGKYCYYDEVSGRIEKEGMTLQDVIVYRMEQYGMTYNQAKRDTISQLKFQPVRWDDITI